MDSPVTQTKKPFEELLLEQGFISEAQVKSAREEARKTGVKIKKVLVKLGFVREEDLAALDALQLGVPYVSINDYDLNPDVVKIFPEILAKKHKVLSLFKIRDRLTVAMSNPADLVAIDELRAKAGCEVDAVLSADSEIAEAIDQYYGASGSLKEFLDELAGSHAVEARGTGEKALATLAAEAPVIKLVNLILMQAIRERASDIHVEPDDEKLRIRFRIDGLMHEILSPPKEFEAPIISRVKVLSQLDIAERRKPQDGRFHVKIENREVDVRVSTLPTVHGENLVMRILDKVGVQLKLPELGFNQNHLRHFERLIRKPYGIILVTGPTGSGKTTTLYAALETINTEDKNIVTVEDPVEYHLKLIRQSQINPKAGLTFATGLRSILRQDPDIIMVGEIRDTETADIAVQAALTGHLVFSTLHTNDAAGALTRLIDMGVEPFLISSTVVGVLAQRLVRRICEHCKEGYQPQEGELASFHMPAGVSIGELMRGKGCIRCKNTGFRGRVGIFELLVMGDAIRKLVARRASSDEIKKKAIEEGMLVLQQDGLAKVAKGVTTLDEVVKSTVEN